MALLGGAAFAASLACCLWTYTVAWGTPHAAAFSPAAVARNLLLFGVFAAHHTVAARPRAKAVIAAVLGDSRVRASYIWTASALLALVCAAWAPVGGIVYQQSGVWVGVHVAIQLAGAWLVAASVGRIDALELAGIRPPSAELETRGPYAWVRHPVYAGWMLMVFGPATMTADRLTFAVVSSAYLVAAMPLEEQSLGRSFGPAYSAYARAVPWRVIPFLF